MTEQELIESGRIDTAGLQKLHREFNEYEDANGHDRSSYSRWLAASGWLDDE